ncbi:N5-glutamine methyltransferase family protein [Brevibacterium sp. VCM10]|uniref:N5-glutamine methyltransferase family protein n=1 Tax=Brevibacterium sp. VCM10 TaxID=1381751 RepID=UPI00046E59DE|nr:hypothetical protein [Brevibacterium sp. VCM10]
MAAQTVAALRAAGCVFAEDEAAILLEAATASAVDSPTVDGPVGDGPAVDGSAGAHAAPRLGELVARRVAGEPLEQIVGWVDFAGLRLNVEPGVFVPRQRTALLATDAVSAVQRMVDSRGNRPETNRGNGAEAEAGVAAVRPVVLEAFCGVGPVASAVAASVPGVDIHLGDAQAEAVGCAVGNAESCVHTGEFGRAGESVPALGSGTTVTGHVLDCLHGLPDTLHRSISVIAAVPPYVPETAADFLPHEALDFEPRTALFGGPDGLGPVRRLITESLDWLAPYGVLLIELGQDQAAEATGFATERGLAARSHLGEDDHTAVLELRRGHWN